PWGEYEAFTPNGAYFSGEGTQIQMTHGITFGIVKPENDLAETTKKLIGAVAASNPHLKERSRFQTAILAGRNALVSTSSGPYPFTGMGEITVTYTTRLPSGNVFFISTDIPDVDHDKYQSVFDRIIRSVSFNTLSSTRAVNTRSWQVVLDAREYWYDTGISVSDLISVSLSASGSITWNPDQYNAVASPFGVKDRPRDFQGTGFPDYNERCGALLIKIGNTIHTAGSGVSIDLSGVNGDETLKFMVNDSDWGLSDNSGTFRIQINAVGRAVSSGNRPESATVTGYVDVVELRGGGCWIRLINGDIVYAGVISFAELSRMAGYPIRTYAEAVRFLNGRHVRVFLSGLTYSTVPGSVINFGNAGQLALTGADKGSGSPQWQETTTSKEIVLDLSTDILFDYDSAVLKPESVETLLKLAQYLRNVKSSAIDLNGFTDSIGSDAYNQRLSAKRASSVKQWLVNQGGIEARRLRTNGFGESQPVASNAHLDGTDNPEGRQRNRRVEVRIPR
ncbi:MAG: OmpA family protein, partial [Pyrinomonadaceae bacterium]